MCGSVRKVLRSTVVSGPVERWTTQNLSECPERVLQLVQRCLCELVLEDSKTFIRIPLGYRCSPGSTQEKPN